MKKYISLFLALVLCGCRTAPSMNQADFSLPEGWKAAVTVTDYSDRSGRLVVIDENGELQSTDIEIGLVDEEHSLPESEDEIWLVPGYTDKEFKPGKTLYALNIENGTVNQLKTEPARFTAAEGRSVYFAKTDSGSPSIMTLDRLNLDSMQIESIETEALFVRAVGAVDGRVCLLTVQDGTNLKANIYDSDLNQVSEQILLDDTVGNVFSCMQNDHMIVMAWHMNGSESYRTMFIIDLLNGDVIRRDLMFSQDGIPVVQDDQYLLLAEAQQRNDVLITRIDMISGTAEEFIFSGTYRSMSADSEYIYLLDQENTVHILDGANPENEINRFEIETSENESCRVIFAH